jgi:hypothetical protein
LWPQTLRANSSSGSPVPTKEELKTDQAMIKPQAFLLDSESQRRLCSAVRPVCIGCCLQVLQWATVPPMGMATCQNVTSTC